MTAILKVALLGASIAVACGLWWSAARGSTPRKAAREAPEAQGTVADEAPPTPESPPQPRLHPGAIRRRRRRGPAKKQPQKVWLPKGSLPAEGAGSAARSGSGGGERPRALQVWVPKAPNRE